VRRRSKSSRIGILMYPLAHHPLRARTRCRYQVMLLPTSTSCRPRTVTTTLPCSVL
jgi:hypothetical protein